MDIPVMLAAMGRFCSKPKSREEIHKFSLPIEQCKEITEALGLTAEQGKEVQKALAQGKKVNIDITIIKK